MAVVRGDSMRPTLAPGDRLLVRYGAAVRPGRVVVARFGDGTVVVKRAVERRATGWWLLGDAAPVGTDSRHRGPVPPEDVLGVVLARLWPRPRHRL
jgi:nickel-type superoxide dismutase maturation protease